MPLVKYGKKCITVLGKTVSALIYFGYTSIIPKDNRLWVFGAWKGRNYSDNSKELFEYVCKTHPEINAVWIAKSQEVYNVLKEEGFKVIFYPSKEASRIIMRARVNVQTESNEDTGRYRVGGTKIIQLFHGFGAAKSPYLYAGMSKLKKSIVKIYADDHSKSYWMVPSEFFIDRCCELFETDRKKMFITGQPRTDLILSNKVVPFFEKLKADNRSKRMILYMPTHRDYGRGEGVCFKESQWKSLDNKLEKKDYILCFKPHPLEIKNYENNFYDLRNIVLIKKGMGLDDASEYLHYFDLLISDYSSIVADFLALDRPIIHFLYDSDNFETDTVKLDVADQLLCGPVCKTWDDVIEILDDCVVEDKFRDIRRKMQKLFFKYIDDNNCERIYQRIMEII